MSHLLEKALFFVLIFSFVFSLPVFALSEEDLLEQIQQLQAQLNSLLKEYSQLTGEEPPSVEGCDVSSFDRNLKMGMAGDDVKCLQIILNSDEETRLREAGAGSPGMETFYFGLLTRQAVIKFQNKYSEDVLAPWGFRWGTGFVGPTTRDKLNEFLVSQPDESPGEDGEDEGQETVQSKRLEASLSTDNPSSTVIFSDGDNNKAGSQALIEFLKLDFSVPEGTETKVSGLKLQRSGLSKSSDLSNVYLYEGDKKIAEAASVSYREISFSKSPYLFKVPEQGKTITVRADLGIDVAEGKTINLTLGSSGDIDTPSSIIQGSFPLEGNSMSVMAMDNIGRMIIATSSNPSSVAPGTKDFKVMAFKLKGRNKDLNVESIKISPIGSAGTSSLANFELYYDEDLLASGSQGADGSVNFDLSASPLGIVSGTQKELYVEADVVGGYAKNIQFAIQRPLDVLCKEKGRGIYIKPDTGVVGGFSPVESRPAKITGGGLVVELSDSSPVGNVALDATDADVAEYRLRALGESIQVNSLVFKATDASSTASFWDQISGVRIVLDGVSVGFLENVQEDVENEIDTDFVVPLGKEKVLKFKADISSPWRTEDGIYDGEYLQIVLLAGEENAETLGSGKVIDFLSVPEMPANELRVVAGAVAADQNPSIGEITAVWEQRDVLLASFVVTAGSEEGMGVEEIILTGVDSQSTTSQDLGDAFEDLDFYYGETRLTSSQTTDVGSSGIVKHHFALSPSLFIPEGASIRLDVRGDVKEDPEWEQGGAIQIYKLTALGRDTQRLLRIGPAGEERVKGQPINIIQAGTLSVAIAPSSPSVQMVEMGQGDVTLGVWEFSANDVEDLSVTQVVVGNVNALGSRNVKNLRMYCGEVKMDPTRESLVLNSAGFGVLQSDDCVIPKGESKLFTLKGDMVSRSKGASSGEKVEFFINLPNQIVGASTDSVIARGAYNYALTDDPGTKAAAAAYPYNTVLDVGLRCHGECEGRARAYNDQMADMVLSGSSEGVEAEVTSLGIGFYGALNNTAQGTTLYLKDQEGKIKASAKYQGSSASGTVLFVPDSPLFIGAEEKVLEIVSDTRKLVAQNTSGHERIQISINLGSPGTPGGIFWSDQLVASDIEWVKSTKQVKSINLWY